MISLSAHGTHVFVSKFHVPSPPNYAEAVCLRAFIRPLSRNVSSQARLCIILGYWDGYKKWYKKDDVRLCLWSPRTE